MRRLSPVVHALAAAAVVVHLATATRYPLFRDELYYLDSTRHIDWGYVDHPPLSIAFLAAWIRLFGDGLVSVHVLPALAHGAVVLLSAALARRLAGGSFAQGLASVAALVAPAYLVMGGFYSMNAFDLVFWAGGYLLLARALESGARRDWLLLGPLVGFGLLNKISLLFFAAGLFVGLAATRERRHLRSAGPWLAAAVALAIFLPHLLWQQAHHWPTLEFMANAKNQKNLQLGPLGFAAGQLREINVLNALLALTGLIYLFAERGASSLRVFAWIFVTVFVVLALQRSKPYYLDAAYPLLFAAGGVALEKFSSQGWRRALRGLVPVSLVILGAIGAPFVLPILSIDRLIAYQDALGARPVAQERAAVSKLAQHYADRFGWEELARAVASAYQGLPADERAHTAIVARNYGQAGALNYYGRQLGLPTAFCPHNSYYLWGPPDDGATAFLMVGHGRARLEATFTSVTEVGHSTSPYAMPYEADQRIYLCRGLKLPLDEAWRRSKLFI
jgi:4-amino-4-deoxy-L-arabinose transferase-like glycosyltransferase